MNTLSLSSDVLAHIGSLPITNTLLDTLFVDAALLGLTYYVYKKTSVVPGFIQVLIELTVNLFYELTESVAGSQTYKIFPYVMSFFIFILFANWSGLLPIISDFGFYHGSNFTPLLRSPSTDLNTTLALALISLTATHTMSIKTIGLKHYLNRFFSLNPLAAYTGIMELISEVVKIISFSFRLFGNIFVGELMLGLLSASYAYILPIPLIIYELFVGFIQATIFALLTMAFMSIFTTKHEPMEATAK